MAQFSLAKPAPAAAAPSSLASGPRLREVKHGKEPTATPYLITGEVLGNPVHLNVPELDDAVSALNLLSAAGDSLAYFAPGIHGVARERFVLTDDPIPAMRDEASGDIIVTIRTI